MSLPKSKSQDPFEKAGESRQKNSQISSKFACPTSSKELKDGMMITGRVGGKRFVAAAFSKLSTIEISTITSGIDIFVLKTKADASLR